MVLHYAQLAADAGGVDAFLIGSELRGLTRVRSATGVYPAVTRLVDAGRRREGDPRLGHDRHLRRRLDRVRRACGRSRARTKCAFRSIRCGRRRRSTSSASTITRRSPTGATAPRISTGRSRQSIYDRAYLAGNLRGGEAYDWYYADDAARGAQTRTPITDGLGKPWVFRVKDIWNWWSNAHYERVGGAELGAPTGWVPQSKPIWLTEIGCPAVDKGANQPSVFPDPKSSEVGLPYFSTGKRDDLIQRRMLEAVLQTFDPAHGATLTNNPVSSVYGGRMLEPSAIHLWTWDARPYPLFPAAIDVWSDGPNWETGHWLTGRLGGAPLDALVARDPR